eukprot:15446810-Alexandrium_andersonii.AAC.1
MGFLLRGASCRFVAYALNTATGWAPRRECSLARWASWGPRPPKGGFGRSTQLSPQGVATLKVLRRISN